MVANVESQKPKKVNLLLWILATFLISSGIGGHYYFVDHSFLLRIVSLLVISGMALWIASKTNGGKIAIKCWQEATVEIKKVVWPTKKETIHSTVAVVAMVFVMAVVLWSLDAILIRVVGRIIGH